MYKRLRIIFPAVQVLAFVAGMLHTGSPLWPVVVCLNYPVWILFRALLAASTRFVPHLGIWFNRAVGALLAASLLSGIALLWYVVVAEIEMRRHGKSVLRFSGWLKELLAVTILFSFGARACMDVYTAGSKFGFSGQGSILRLNPADAAYADEFRCVLIVTAWGAVLVGVAIQDLVTFLKDRAHGATPPASS